MIRWNNLSTLLKIANITWTNQCNCKLATQLKSLEIAPTGAFSRRFESSSHGVQFPEASLESSYTNEQQDNILKVLNDSTIEELCEYDVTKSRAASLVRHRRKKREFAKVDDILEVDGFGLGLIQTLCDSIVYGLSKDTKKRHKSIWQRICTPRISEDLKTSLSSVVSMHILPTEILWLQLGRDLTLMEWELMSTEKNSSYNHKSNLEMVHKIVQRLPRADAYIMEQRQLKIKQVSVLPVLLGIIQLESMLTALLNSDFASTGQHRVFMIRENVVGKFFSLKVGNENISSQNVVTNILDGSHCLDIHNVCINPSHQFWYQKQAPAVREELANLLLQAIAFYELEILRNKML